MQGKIAIVTGGGGNIGVGVCRALAKAGATVVAVDLDASRAEAAKRAIDADLTDPAACAAAVASVVSEFGGVDALVNLAQGWPAPTPVTEVSDEQLRLTFETGPMATLRMMQLCYPHLVARGGGSVVNTASGVGTGGIHGWTAYAAAKEAIRGITKVAALEWGPDNINVNAIAPLASGQHEDAEWASQALQGNPMGRIGDPEADVGSAVVYLAGPGRYVTGRTLQVDGGVGFWR